MLSSSSSPPSSDSTLLSPSSSSSSSPSSHLKPNNQNSESKTTQTQKTMEEVWNDITINSLPNTPISHIHSIHHPTSTNTASHYKGFIFQDFLNGSGNYPTNLRNSSVDLPPLPPRTTTTEFQFLDNEFQLQGNPSVPSMISGVAPFDNLASSSVLATFATAVNSGCGGGFDNKKVADNVVDGSVDRVRRHKRMIKNRESAARSRARKQAYITELELEIDNFRKENAALRKQQLQLIEAPPAQLPKKHGLRRTLTAPF
ncbi:protein FD-like [Chenopodium quinoa]|uniref:protein FD-like n=1 Tax=Chenopodium quinoa TaxID=63459 RepID=UPI000B785822|nr:protein FD-like [Chenopodium quinoa]